MRRRSGVCRRFNKSRSSSSGGTKKVEGSCWRKSRGNELTKERLKPLEARESLAGAAVKGRKRRRPKATVTVKWLRTLVADPPLPLWLPLTVKEVHRSQHRNMTVARGVEEGAGVTGAEEVEVVGEVEAEEPRGILVLPLSEPLRSNLCVLYDIRYFRSIMGLTLDRSPLPVCRIFNTSFQV
jgi:hypothetical protein